jgi:hypothetical protein
MTHNAPGPLSRGAILLPPRSKPLILGFLYWFAFVLVLEPDNALRAFHAGYILGFHHEAIRMIGAGLLGAPTAPLILRLSRRFPIRGPRALRNALVHFVGYLVLAALLILVSCFLAAWMFDGHVLPAAGRVCTQLISNWTLLVFALCGLAAVAHVIEGHLSTLPRDVAGESGRQARFPVKVAGRLRFVGVQDIDWIEAQGNYVAFHVGKDTHLVRRTLMAIESELNSHDFVRVHRRLIVAIREVEEMKSLATGDARLTLRDGTELKVSRRYRAAARERWTHYSATQRALPPTAAGSA